MDQVNKALSSLTQQTKNLPVLKDIAEKTGLETGQITVGLGVIGVIFLLFGIGAHIITDSIGILYPAYMSFKAIESPESDDDKQWLTYWVVFAIFRVLDDWSDVLFSWLPFYYPIKLAFLIFLFAPQTKGALTIYEKAIRPFFKENEARIDAGITKVTQVSAQVGAIAKEEAIKQGTNQFLKNMANN